MYNNTINLIGLYDPEKEKEEKAKRLKSSVERKKTTTEKKYNDFCKKLKYNKVKK
tara:strand:- start:330 stop:494 length:165 start_codon:yes stop_codon:yes gene_type:complete